MVLLAVVNRFYRSIAEPLFNDTELMIVFGPKSLHRFKNLGDQTILHWVYEAPSKEFVVRFSGTVNQTGGGISVHCADTPVHLVIRKGGIPVPNPLNTSLPESTIIDSSGVVFDGNFTLSESVQGQVHDIIIHHSFHNLLDGHYFAGMFLPKEVESIDVAGLTKDCKYYTSLEVHKLNINSSNVSLVSDSVRLENNAVILTRKQSGLFNVQFISNVSSYNLTSNSSMQFSWDIYPVTDSGGNLYITMKAFALPLELPPAVNLSVIGYLQSQPNITGGGWFDGKLLLLNDTADGQQYTWQIPYPISGPWLLDIQLECLGDTATCNNITQEFQASITVGSCIKDCEKKSGQGSCGLYRYDDVLLNACRCKVGWQGIACTDGSEALSYWAQLEQTLLLTLSNVLFLVCAAVAVYRWYYTEALVYFFVAFMSTFYHACDQPGAAKYCMMKYETLQFSDFLSSVCAIWFTLTALAKPPQVIESWLHVAGCLAFAVGVSYDRFSVYTVLIPGLIGAVLVIFSWSLQCRARHACYPGKKKTAFAILPGLAFAVTGLCLYAFVETSDNYYIIHSLWHIFMALAVLFLLPVGPKSYSKNRFDLDRETLSKALTARVADDGTYQSYSDSSLNVA